jgi:hypothetical protein
MTNYDGLAELGWRGTRTVNGMNGYYNWEKLDDAQKQMLNLQWNELPASAKQYLRDAVIAAIDAYQSAVLL